MPDSWLWILQKYYKPAPILARQIIANSSRNKTSAHTSRNPCNMNIHLWVNYNPVTELGNATFALAITAKDQFKLQVYL